MLNGWSEEHINPPRVNISCVEAMATRISYKKRDHTGVYREIYERLIPNPQVKTWADQVCAAHPELSRIHAVLMWIQQNIHYISDQEKYAAQGWTDVFQDPLITISDGTGDCDDFAILAAAALATQGYTVYLMLGEVPYGYHAWVELHCNSGWYIIESETQYIVPESSRPMFGYFPHHQITKDGNYSLP
jgi:hypothetical protein